MIPAKSANRSLLLLVACLCLAPAVDAAQADAVRTVTSAECTVASLGESIAPTGIGEPVSAVALAAPVWNAATGEIPAHCSVDGSMVPADPVETARPINFRVVLPAEWSGRSAQLGGGGMNGTIPNLTRSVMSQGYVTYGSDSGHQAGFFGRGLPEGARGRGGAQTAAGRGGGRSATVGAANDRTLNDEAIRNLGYMQMKKTHDAAMVLIDRMYGAAPAFNY